MSNTLFRGFCTATGLLLALMLFVVAVPNSLAADTTSGGSNPFTTDLVGGVGQTPGLSQYTQQETNPILIVARLIRIALSFVGIGLVGLLVYAGYTYMTAAGDDAKVSESKSTMKNAIVGLVVIMMALTLSSFIIYRLMVATRSYGRGGLLQQLGNDVTNSIRAPGD